MLPYPSCANQAPHFSILPQFPHVCRMEHIDSRISVLSICLQRLRKTLSLAVQTNHVKCNSNRLKHQAVASANSYPAMPAASRGLNVKTAPLWEGNRGSNCHRRQEGNKASSVCCFLHANEDKRSGHISIDDESEKCENIAGSNQFLVPQLRNR